MPFSQKILPKSVNCWSIKIGQLKIITFLIYIYGILLDTGGEALAGSTRLKAGTSQKICLNLISTMVMARLGRVKNGEMNCLIATNNKLKNRIKRIKNST